MRPDPTMPTPEPGQQVMRIGGEDSTIPAWYLVTIPVGGIPSCSTRVLLDPAERQAIADGAELRLTLYGGELPWRIEVTP